MSSSITRQCLICNASFKVDRYSVSKGAGKYCSLECKYTAGRITRICKGCNKRFTVTKSGNSTFCSSKCVDIRRPITCARCGIEFLAQPHRIRKGIKFCSSECRFSEEASAKQSKIATPCLDCGDTLNLKSAGRCLPCYRRYRNRGIKQTVIDNYGGRCACCGESAFEFLTVDHKNNDGAQHRFEHFQKSGKLLFGGALYLQIIRDQFPDMFQILCWNCNLAKSLFGICPHLRTHGQ